VLAHYAEQYHVLEERHWWWQARNQYVLKWIGTLARQQRFGRILDIGCGDGLLFGELAKFGEVWGIETDEHLVAQSPWRSRIERRAFGPDYRSDRQFDLIVMLDVLEHIQYDVESLWVVRNLLRPGGVLLLTVPALPALWSHHDTVNCHYRRYTLPTLRRAVERSGFDRIEGHYFFGWTILPMFLRRLLYPANDAIAAAPKGYAVGVPQAHVNRLLYSACLLEQRLSAWRGMPLGSSIFTVARRPLEVPHTPERNGWSKAAPVRA
jgi:2-polyprenyl-3-methyl-5-hydroxy-6-metoxy-1,4-benzoquinol methylase